jgi:hypothetical protein
MNYLIKAKQGNACKAGWRKGIGNTSIKFFHQDYLYKVNVYMESGLKLFPKNDLFFVFYTL